MGDLSNSFNRDKVIMKKNQLEVKNIIADKKTLWRINSRLQGAEEHIRDLEVRAKESTQVEHKEKYF